MRDHLVYVEDATEEEVDEKGIAAPDLVAPQDDVAMDTS